MINPVTGYLDLLITSKINKHDEEVVQTNDVELVEDGINSDSKHYWFFCKIHVENPMNNKVTHTINVSGGCTPDNSSHFEEPELDEIDNEFDVVILNSHLAVRYPTDHDDLD